MMADTAQHPYLVPADPSWPRAAARVITDLAAATDWPIERFQHIGSTAIPDMPAKPVLDVQAQVPDLDGLGAQSRQRLSELGYQRSDEVTGDHVPVWISPRGVAGDHSGATTGWRKRLWIRREPGPAVNCHIRLAGAANARLALLFRDWMRAHPQESMAYGQFKERLAGLSDDVASYSDTKDPVVDMVAATAARWARDVGWTPPAQ